MYKLKAYYVQKKDVLEKPESLHWFDWLQQESRRLIEKQQDAEYGICGNEWLIVEYLRKAEQMGMGDEFLRALQNCVCQEISDMAAELVEKAA
ncbi:MAG TPA: hypothetical protein EYP34_11395 [Chromatiaceae bacterium]|nr:hypothetical protein [Chromatiaceae bacterium]